MSIGGKGFKLAEWRGMTPLNVQTQRMGISFDAVDGSIIRLNISKQSAMHIYQCLDDYLYNQSAMSFDIPKVDGSTPLDGQSECPPVKSSTAC